MLSVILEFDSFHSTNHDAGNESEGVLPALFAINHVDRLRKFVIQHAMKAIEHKCEDESVHAPLIRKVHDYIDANFSNSTLRLDDIARANFISTQYLCSIYRRATNATIGDYIFEVRMNHAQHLISIGQRNVTALSEACGYNDPDYFCKCFRKKFGMTPRQYIERQNS